MTGLRSRAARPYDLAGGAGFCAALFLTISSFGCGSLFRSESAPVFGDHPKPQDSTLEYSFGIPPAHNPVQVLALYQPMIEAINLQARGFSLRLETGRDYAAYNSKIRARSLDFAMLNPHQVVPAVDLRKYKVFGKAGPQDRLRGLIVVRKDSTVRQVRDLRGATISFPSPTELAGTMMPKLFLKIHGLDVAKETEVRYAGSQESAVMNVFLDLTTAACVSSSFWQSLSESRPDLTQALAVRWETDSLVGVGLVAREELPEEHVVVVSRALFGLKESKAGRAILERIGVSGFEPASSPHYDPAWEFLLDYKRAFRQQANLSGLE